MVGDIPAGETDLEEGLGPRVSVDPESRRDAPSVIQLRQQVNDAAGVICQPHPKVAIERAIDRRISGRRSVFTPNHRIVGFLVDDGVHLPHLQDGCREPGRRGIARGKQGDSGFDESSGIVQAACIGGIDRRV
jgi:hypothetical protein